MPLPLLQLALDNRSLPDALTATRLLATEVDVLEAGTILIGAEGMQAVRCLKTLYPDRIVLADIKAADAGSILADMCFGSGADWMTVICCAPIATVTSAMAEAKKRGAGYDVQVELTGSWSWEEAKAWRAAGLSQLVYHRGRDAQAAGQSWSDEDLAKIRRLADMGFALSITGGLTIDDLPLFAGLPVKVFIAGRAIRDAADPAAAARAFKARIAELWG
ncbi:3-dehydro-L-gulonate-6-phosphate decarboxylase [Telmatospirillum sp.]|uniref:3-dehydro-L-gulonate-6-phosphate decarboxylase n=1 Tax=Telmatospirillum sp. TaxID=2079197 RepID=UPI00285070D4|nr:3-dehydro-L-gulonate-6-phosphate decarboxylase [Telmatospirillum sp.]MDR3440023.1 3-dehydro-L-gulonate-6-phosphate decarboxylase [Telmatospirillum sp.]